MVSCPSKRFEVGEVRGGFDVFLADGMSLAHENLARLGSNFPFHIIDLLDSQPDKADIEAR